jgi:peptide/nickel transport system ATP-binding protein
MSDVRGNRMAMIFQEPMTSLNPAYTIGNQLEEALLRHRRMPRRKARERAVYLLDRVGITAASSRLGQYPHQLSGGLRQRVMIAMALMCGPSLILADEPTTALDVTIQAQILDMMKRLREEVGTSILLITHDMGVVADMADDVAVMYGGRIVESGAVETIFAASAHPYTRLLFATAPRLNGARKTLLRTIEGAVPGAGDWPAGCRFRARCPLADAKCIETPPLCDIKPGHRAACWHSDRVAALA